MHNGAKPRGFAGLVAVIAGVALIGASGAAFLLGWAVWAVGLGALLTAVPSAGGDDHHRPASVTALPSATSGIGNQRAA